MQWFSGIFDKVEDKVGDKAGQNGALGNRAGLSPIPPYISDARSEAAAA